MSTGSRHEPPLRIGLISDTHDLVRPEALAFLAGSDRIVHAGDICSPEVLDALAAIADDEDRAIVAATFRHVPPPA